MKALFEDYKTKKVGIVGPPNVGKSTLFNLLLKKRKALVKNFKGLTRDFLIGEVTLESICFTLVDTGGISIKKDLLSRAVTENVYSHLNGFDLIIFVLDQKSQTLYEAKDILKKIRQTHKPFITVINKIDGPKNISFYTSELNQLGVQMIPASFESQKGLQGIQRWILTHLSPKIKKSPIKNSFKEISSKKEVIHLALMGKTNVGKSLLKNKLLGYQRMLISSQKGTTFDPVTTWLQLNQANYFLTDTAGFSKNIQKKKEIESLSHFFSKRILKKADIVLLVIDILEKKISKQDLKIARLIIEAKKALILVLNKIDCEKNTEFKKKSILVRKTFRESIQKEFHFFPNVPAVFTSAKTGAGISQLLKKIDHVSKQLQFRVSTSSLNQFLRESIFKTDSNTRTIKNQFKFFYSTQVDHTPPSFVFFGKNSDQIKKNQARFFVKSIQKKWDLNSVPLKLFFKEKS